MRLITRVWFWFLAVPMLFVGSFALSFGLFAALDRFFGATPLNMWGDMEGLVVAVWTGSAALFVAGLAVLIAQLLRVTRDARS